MRKAILALGLLATVGLVAPRPASASDVSVVIGLPGFGLFVGRPPVVVAPPPVVYVPPPVVYGPSVYVAPAYARRFRHPYHGRPVYRGRYAGHGHGRHHGHH
jgi:hypothetical protein